jgi:hypothetical protein
MACPSKIAARLAVVLNLVLVVGAAHAELLVPAEITVEATGPDGAMVPFTGLVTVAGGSDGSDGRPADTVVCAPASGSIFPIGTTNVSCAGSEGSTGSFTITVEDRTSPRMHVPRDFSVVTSSAAGEAVSYTAFATDLVDGSVAIVCVPASGSTFPLGMTSVTCTAGDSHGNTASAGFNITLATIAPPPGNPDLTVEATGPEGARVTFNTGDADDDHGRPGSGGCSPAPGTTFPLGLTTVVCPSGNFIVSVVDTRPPALNLPLIVMAVAGEAGSVPVLFMATASDAVDGSVPIVCTPPSGSTFLLGTTTVNCSATDSRGNSNNESFEVHVTAAPVPLPNPDDITAEATGPGGAVVTFDFGLDGIGRPITCSPASGSAFPLGTTPVTCPATGSDGNAATISFLVTVVDTTAPALHLPASMTLEATSPAGAAAIFVATADDLVDGATPVGCTPASASTFALGTTTVTCTAIDSRGNLATGAFTVTVVDTTPPEITTISVSPAVIWPPNGKLVDVEVTVAVDDIADPMPVAQLAAITCNEPISYGDAVVTGPLTAALRADRSAHGNGRLYTLHVHAIDASGNGSIATVVVSVPHDQSDNTAPAKRRSAGR